MRAKRNVAPCEILTIVYFEVHMMQSMMGRVVYELTSPMSTNHITIVNEDCPELNSDEKTHV
jgi:hypothetical protein